MHSKINVFLFAATSFAIAALCGASTLWAATYQVKDLGDLGGGYTVSQGMNNSGVVVGYSYLPSFQPHAFTFSGAGPIHNMDPPTAFGSMAFAINNQGQIVGNEAFAAAYTYGFISQNGVRQYLGTLGGSSSTAVAINNHSQIVGKSNPTGSTSFRAFISNNGGPLQDLGTLSGGTMSAANGINDNGVVVGVADSGASSHPNHAFVWDGSGALQDINPPGAANSTAKAIDNLGEIVGNAQFTGGLKHAFLFYENSPAIDLGTLGGTTSDAYDINENGQIVGSASNAAGLQRAFLANRGGPLQDLNNFIDPASGWTLYNASSINDNGWITGFGLSPSGLQHSYLLIPVPEPSSLALLAAGAISLIACRRKFRTGIPSRQR